MGTSWKSAVHGIVRVQSGVIAVRQAVEAGCSRRDAYRLVERGDFGLVMPGILHSAHWPVRREQLMIAACLRNERAVIAWTTACQEWTFRGVPKDDDVHVLVPHGSSPELPGVTVHRCRRIDPVDIVERSDGTRITSPSRTLFDSADVLGVTRAASIFEQLIDERRGSFVTHAATLTRLAAPGRPGTRTMRAVIDSRPSWRSAMQSALEVRVLTAIERAGLPRPEVQFRCARPGGLSVRFDVAWPSDVVALEIDLPFWHAGRCESA